MTARRSPCAPTIDRKQPYFSLNLNGRTRLIYLGQKRAPQARTYSHNHQLLKNIVDEMTKLNMLLLKKNWD